MLQRFAGTRGIAPFITIMMSALALGGLAQAAPANRIAGPIDESRTVTIPGHINVRAQAGTDNGAVETSFALNDMVMTLTPSAAQQAELEAFLAAQQDAASPEYHAWLSPAQFADRFGASAADIAQITAWLEAKGFSVGSVAASRNAITFSGTAATAQAAFGVEIHRYTVAGQNHFATATEPRVPAAIGGMVAGFRGFDDFLPQHPRTAARAAYTAASGKHYLAPDDVATIYNLNTLYSKGYDGTGQSIAVVGQSAISLTDIENFRSIFNLAKNDPQLVTVPNMTVPGTVSGDVEESDLDLEWAGAVAKNASVIFVYTSNAFSALQYAVTQNLAPVISVSYGLCETGSSAEGASLRAIAQQANAEGITILSASGDAGAFSCESSTASVASHAAAVTLPASVPEITAVGGTQFNEGSGTYWNSSNGANNGSAISYIPEAVWNESSVSGGLSASGGGASALFTKPAWQAGPGVPADGARDVPDVAMAAAAAHDGAIICTSGGCAKGISGGSVVGGTSLATPLFAGITALLNQYEVKTGALAKAGLGNINPILYPIAQNYADAFHDITTGTSAEPCRVSATICPTGSFGYAAGPGYDQATGLGSVNAYALATDWALIQAAPAALSGVAINPSAIAGGASAAVTVSLSGAAPAAGATVALAGTSAVFPVPASVVVPAGSYSASVNVASTAVTAATTVTVTATYSGATKSAAVTVSPVVLPSLTSVSVPQATVAGGASVVLSVQLSAAAPTGGASVALASSSTAFPVPATITVPAGAKSASVTVQTTTVTASTTATIKATYNGASQSASITLTPVTLPTLSSVAVSPASLTGGASAQLSVTLSAAAPAGGAAVTLASSSAAITVPATITVQAGQKQASVTVQTTAVTANTTATITAKYNGGTQTASVTITPVVLPSLSSVAVAQTSITGGASDQVTVALSAAAPPGGASVTLASSSAAFPVPSTVVVAAGQKSASVNVQSTAVTASSSVTVTAKYNGGTQTATVTLTPVVLPNLVSIAPAQASVTGGATDSLTVTLSAAAPSGGATVTLSSGNAALTLPASVVVAAGRTTANVNVQTSAVTASTAVTVTAKYNGGTQTATVTLTPVVLPSLASVAVTAGPSSALFGSTGDFVTVTLSGAAPSGGASVALTSSSTAFAVPATLVVPAGQKSASVIVLPASVTASTVVTITAKYNGGTQTTTTTLAPAVAAAVASVTVSPSSITGGAQTVIQVQLTAAAPQGGAAVTLTSSNSTAFPLPATVTVPAGLNELVVIATTTAVKASTSVTVTAGYGGVSKTATVTLTPAVIPTITALTVNPTSVKGGATATLSITLSGAAEPGGATVTLASSSAAVTVPASVTIPAGGDSGILLRIQTSAVMASTPVTITATSGGTSKTATLTVTP